MCARPHSLAAGVFAGEISSRPRLQRRPSAMAQPHHPDAAPPGEDEARVPGLPEVRPDLPSLQGHETDAETCFESTFGLSLREGSVLSKQFN